MTELHVHTQPAIFYAISAVASPPLLITPAMLAWQGKYISSGFYQGHIAFIILLLGIFLFIWQEVRICSNRLVLTRFGIWEKKHNYTNI